MREIKIIGDLQPISSKEWAKIVKFCNKMSLRGFEFSFSNFYVDNTKNDKVDENDKIDGK